MKTLSNLLLPALLLLSPMAMAHPGHDHSAVTAPLIHFVWALPVVATVGYLLHRRGVFSSLLAKLRK